MQEQIEKFRNLIESSSSILITSHISPDPDAVSSVLLMGATLKLNFPDKKVLMVLEEEIPSLDFLSAYRDIDFQVIIDALGKYEPGLFIMLDGNNYERCSRHDGQKVREYLESRKIKTAVIDHHEIEGADQTDVYINNNSPACVQDVYETCFKELNLNKPSDYAQITMTGLYSDTGGFVYMKDGTHKKLFELVDELISAGADIEKLRNLLSRYSEADVRVLEELLGNTNHQHDYTYSFLSDKFVGDGNKMPGELQKGTGIFLDEFVRNIDGRQWGFIVYRNLLQGDNMYSVSLRAVSGVRDVSKIASTLGGGGHKPAAGAKFEAQSASDAVEKVKATIESLN